MGSRRVSRQDIIRAMLTTAFVPGLTALPSAAIARTTQEKPASPQGGTEQNPAGTRQTRVEDETPNVADIVVTGQRLGFSTTSQIKRDAPQSVSVLTTTDLRNIPDTVLIDIVRRIPGVQVSQGGGGGIVSIRGLPQTETRLNGRNFPSSVSRSFNYAALPGDLVSGVAVYKTPTADQIEGGVAGIIDFRTRRPFDFSGFAAAGTAKGVYTNIDDKIDPVLSGYASNRWKAGDNEFGVLIGGSFQRQRNGLDLLATDGNLLQTGAGGNNIDAPTTVYKRYFFNDRELSTGYGSLQWRSGAIESVVDIIYSEVKATGGTQSLGARLSDGTPTAPFALYPNSNIFRSGNYTNVPLGSGTDLFGSTLKAFQAGWNTVYMPDDRSKIVVDINYNTSTGTGSGGGISMVATAPTVSYNHDQSYPFYTVTGVDQKSLSAYRYESLYEYFSRDATRNFAARVDGTYKFDGVVRNVQVGLRYDRRTIDRTGGFLATDAPASIASPAQNSFAQLTQDDLYKSKGVEQRQWATIGYDALLGGLGQTRTLFGSAVTPSNPAQAYDGAEKTLASYGMASLVFEVAGIPVDGNVGIRLVETDLTVNGTRTSSTGGNRVPVTFKSSYLNALPSINMRLTLAEQLFLRLSYSKQISRPSFGQVSPIVSLSPATLTGSAGNPGLKPLKADQFDASLEHYFGPDNSIYVAGFYKKLDGFVANEVVSQGFDGLNYRITRPQNLRPGYIAGTEIGYRQTFSFLPGALSGLGVQGSYTYVNGTKRANNAGYVTPYEQITRHNYQLSGFFDKYGLRANVNWVWRSRLLEATSGDPRGRPDYRIPFGQLDANLVYTLTPRVSLVLSGTNLTQSLIRRSFQDTRFFAQNALENRRLLAGVQFRLGGGI